MGGFHVAYFNSYALWNYLTAPFQFASSGYVLEELEEWEENGERWRPLKVTFPDGLATDTKEQVADFAQDGLLRRLEYAVDVLGGPKESTTSPTTARSMGSCCR